MNKIFLFAVTLLLLSLNVYSQERNFEKDFFSNKSFRNYQNVQLASPKTDNYDLKHYTFNLDIDSEKNYISGNVTANFLVTKGDKDKIYFDFNSQMQVEKILYHNQELNSRFSSTYELEVDLPSKLVKGTMDSITIWYKGNPTTSGFGSFETANQRCDQSKPLLWTLSEPYGARDWWPTKQSLNDKIDSIDMYVTTPTGYKVGSNGLLKSVANINGKLVHHWKHNYPEPAYLIAIAVSNYTEYIDWVPLDNGDSLMVLEYVFPCNIDDAKAGTADIIPTMQFYISLFGNYPFDKEKYGHAQFGWGGGMEHSSMTFVSGFSHSLLAHELAHQWFGDKITCGSWQDIWLNEGFATYLEGLTYDFDRQPYYWKSWREKNKARALFADHGSVFVDDTSSVNRIFNGSLSYSKGAYLLHMLRWKLGDDDFFKALHNYINDPKLAYSYARTHDLQEHLEAQSGQDLNEFFNDWLYGKGFPTYSFQWWYNTEGKLLIQVNQTQSDSSVDYFEMPIPIQLKGENKDTTVVLDNNEDGQIFEFDLDFKVSEFIYDPEIWLCAALKETNYLGTDIISEPNSIILFPNPVTDILILNSQSNIPLKVVSIYDVNGIKVLSGELKNNSISVKNLPAGFYLAKITTDKEVYAKRFMKK